MADDDGTDPLRFLAQQFSRLLVLHELRHPWREAPYSKRKPEGPHYFPDRLETLFDSLPKNFFPNNGITGVVGGPTMQFIVII